MAHATSLRVIGQSLEVAKLRVFELETDGSNYVLTSDSLTAASEWILRHVLSPNDISEESARPSAIRSVRFTTADISRLDDQARKQRKLTSTDNQVHSRLSRLLRTLGDHFDRSEASAFHISWMYDSVSIESRSAGGEIDSRTFTAEKLDQLASHSRFRRFSRPRFNSKRPNSLKHN
jgi:hypothetical protein